MAKTFTDQLKAALHRIDCPNLDEFVAYRDGAMGFARRRDIQQHLRECSSCRDELAILSISYSGSEVNSSEFQPGLLNTTLNKIHILFASLKLQESPQLRGVQPTNNDSQTVFYQVLDRVGWELSLTIESGQAGYLVYGQLDTKSDPIPQDGNALLLQKGTLTQPTEITETGWFEFDEVPVGNYSLWLEWEHARIEVGQTNVGPPIAPKTT